MKLKFKVGDRVVYENQFSSIKLYGVITGFCEPNEFFSEIRYKVYYSGFEDDGTPFEFNDNDRESNLRKLTKLEQVLK